MAEATANQLRAEQLLQDLWADKDIGASIQKRAKEKFPDVRTADDALQPVLAPILKQNEALSEQIKAMQEERAAEKKAVADKAAEDQKVGFEQAINSARASFNLTDEGFDAMVARMKATGNYTDPEAAAAWVASKTPPARVSGPTFGPQNMDLFGSHKADEKFAQLHRDPVGFMDAELNEFVRNPDEYVRQTFGA